MQKQRKQMHNEWGRLGRKRIQKKQVNRFKKQAMKIMTVATNFNAENRCGKKGGHCSYKCRKKWKKIEDNAIS